MEDERPQSEQPKAKAKAKAKGKAKAKAKTSQPKAKASAKNDAGEDSKADDLSDEDRQIKKDIAVESFQEGLENTKVVVVPNPKRKRSSEGMKENTENTDKTPLGSHEASASKPTNRNLEEEFENVGANLPDASSGSGMKRPLPQDQEPLVDSKFNVSK